MNGAFVPIDPDVASRKATSGKSRNSTYTVAKMYSYAEKVYGLDTQLNALPDSRASNRSIPFRDLIVSPMALLMMRFPSFRQFYGSGLLRTIRENCCHAPRTGKIPSRDAVEDVLHRIEPDNLKTILYNIVNKAHENRVFQDNTVDGLLAAGLDGVELGSSTKKKPCELCLTRVHKNGQEEHYHRAVVVTSIGGSVRIPIGYEFQKAGDGDRKDEGELTAAKRLLPKMKTRLNFFPDVLAADAEYANAPFINLLKELGTAGVIRLRGENRKILREARAAFDAGLAELEVEFLGQKRNGQLVVVKASESHDFTMGGVDGPVRVLRFIEVPVDKYGNVTSLEDVSEGFVIVTTDAIAITTAWKIIHLRWDTENCGFWDQKTEAYADHIFSHACLEQVYALILIAQAIWNLYLCRFRARDFLGSGESRLTVALFMKAKCMSEWLYLHFPNAP